MRYVNQEKVRIDQMLQLKELRTRIDEGEAVFRMTESDGWKILSNLFGEQLEAYKADMLLGCKDWDEYLEKRSKAFAINLLMQDIEDYVRMGTEAAEQIDRLQQ